MQQASASKLWRREIELQNETKSAVMATTLPNGFLLDLNIRIITNDIRY